MTAGSVVLAADIGGTNAKLALARFDGSARTLLKLANYPSGEYPALESVVHAFFRDADVTPHVAHLTAACFAVAGPVENGQARLTNLTWQIDESALAEACALPRVRVINDFAAAALGIAELAPQDFLTLQSGTPVARGERVVIGAGTGLGVGLLSWCEGRYHVHASEGGHADFAPGDALQDQFVAYLRRSFAHVSAERVLSGAGLPRILRFLEESTGQRAGTALVDAMAQADPAVAITNFALTARDELATRALDVFVAAYGNFAGSMALTTLAHGGVYVAGGIAPKISAKLANGTFMRAFSSKGRFKSLLETLPVQVVMNAQVGLYGALAEAACLANAA